MQPAKNKIPGSWCHCHSLYLGGDFIVWGWRDFLRSEAPKNPQMKTNEIENGKCKWKSPKNVSRNDLKSFYLALPVVVLRWLKNWLSPHSALMLAGGWECTPSRRRRPFPLAFSLPSPNPCVFLLPYPPPLWRWGPWPWPGAIVAAAERGGAVQGADGPALGGRARPTAGSFPGKAAAWFGRCSSPNCLSSFSAVRWGHGWAVACVPLLKDAWRQMFLTALRVEGS